jgi:6-phosphogluconolactonase (cycloisomerase 2 family)
LLYVANSGSNNVTGFTINAATGALTSLGNTATGTGPDYLDITPDGNFLYVGNGTGGTVSGFSINDVTGALTATPSSPYLAGGTTRGVAVDPTGEFVFAVSGTANQVDAYTLNASTGQLTGNGTGPGLATPQGITIDGSGTYAYVGNSGGGIEGFEINANGTLTPLGGTPYNGGTNYTSVSADPTGSYVYGLQTLGIDIFEIDPDTGDLTYLDTESSPGGTSSHNSILVDPRGEYLYLVSGTGGLSVFALDLTTGTLSLISTQAAGTTPLRVAVAIVTES